MKKSIYSLIFILTLSQSCDYYIKKEGQVLSNLDGKPIKNATISLKEIGETVYTDSLGKFTFAHSGGGRGPRSIFTVKKNGYKDFEVEFEKNANEEIVKVKSDIKIYDLNGKYFYPDSTNLTIYSSNIGFSKYSTDYSIKDDSIIIYLDPYNEQLDLAKYISRYTINGGKSIIK